MCFNYLYTFWIIFQYISNNILFYIIISERWYTSCSKTSNKYHVYHNIRCWSFWINHKYWKEVIRILDNKITGIFGTYHVYKILCHTMDSLWFLQMDQCGGKGTLCYYIHLANLSKIELRIIPTPSSLLTVW